MNYAETFPVSETALAGHADVRVGDLVLQPSRLLLAGPAAAARIEPKGILVLLMLAEASGETVSREAMYARLWGGLFVGDDSLNRAIHIARRALRECGSVLSIETIPRIGYRLCGVGPAIEATVGDVANSAGSPPWTSRRMALAGIAAVALAGTGGWALRRRSRLIEARETTEEARRLLRSEAPGQSERAAAMLRRVNALEPGYAPAWGLLAHGLAKVEAPPAGANEAQRAAARALAIDPGEPLARLAVASLRAGLVDWTVTEGEFRRILAEHDRTVEVMDSLGFLLQGLGHGDESWRLIERAIAIDPFAAGPQYKRGIKLWIRGELDESNRVTERAMQLWPGHPWVWNARFMTLMFSERVGAARAMLADRHSQPEAIAIPALATWGTGLDALEAPTAANIAKARKAFLQSAPRSPGLAVHGVMLLSALGEVNAAYDIIDLLVFNGGPLAGPAARLKSETLLSDVSWRQTQWLFTPPLGAVRDDPRYADLTERSGLAAYWQKTGKGPEPVRTWRKA